MHAICVHVKYRARHGARAPRRIAGAPRIRDGVGPPTKECPHMHAHIVLAHPEPKSFNAHLTEVARGALERDGWSVTLSDLYAMGFDPCERAEHFSPRQNPERFDVMAEHRFASDHGAVPRPVAEEIARIDRADLVILQYPMWWHLPPAMLKGWFDRLMMPGVAFDLSNPNMAVPLLMNLKRIAAITTYGRPWWNALLVGNPPKRIMTRYVPRFTGGRAKVDYYPLYHMNVATEEKRKAFIAKVRAAMLRF
jgi:putative NADPH-quinone reductase